MERKGEKKERKIILGFENMVSKKEIERKEKRKEGRNK